MIESKAFEWLTSGIAESITCATEDGNLKYEMVDSDTWFEVVYNTYGIEVDRYGITAGCVADADDSVDMYEAECFVDKVRYDRLVVMSIEDDGVLVSEAYDVCLGDVYVKGRTVGEYAKHMKNVSIVFVTKNGYAGTILDANGTLADTVRVK